MVKPVTVWELAMEVMDKVDTEATVWEVAMEATDKQDTEWEVWALAMEVMVWVAVMVKLAMVKLVMVKLVMVKLVMVKLVMVKLVMVKLVMVKLATEVWEDMVVWEEPMDNLDTVVLMVLVMVHKLPDIHSQEHQPVFPLQDQNTLILHHQPLQWNKKRRLVN